MTGARRTIATIALLGASWGILWSKAGARTFHVSPFGSNTPPYDTYAKAAHNIQDAVDQTQANDTVRIGTGIYHPDTTIILRDSIVVMGAGWDSTIIWPQTDIWPQTEYRTIFYFGSPAFGGGGGLELQGCTIRGFNSPRTNFPIQDGLFIQIKREAPSRIHDCYFVYLDHALNLGDANAIVYDNAFDSNYIAVELDFDGPFDVHHNLILARGGAQGIALGIIDGLNILGPAHIHHNSILTERGVAIGMAVRHGDSLIIYNNLILAASWWPVFTYCDCGGLVFRNNTVIRTEPEPSWPIASFASERGSGLIVENNVFSGRDGTVKVYYGYPARFSYNDLWGLTGEPGTGRIYALDYGTEIDSSGGNLYVNPMFADDSVYRLQRGSPLIDAGNPAVSDPDGSRSDIGWLGGPGGTTHIYSELPPQTPDSVSGDDTACFRLSWRGNSEADLCGYRLYRSGQSGFTPSGASLRAAIPAPDTTFTDSLDGATLPLYYKVTAIDTAGLESDPSPEIAWVLSAICDTGDGVEVIPNTPAILRLYPNPFNASVTIEYFVPDVGDPAIVPRLAVLNVLGQHVADLEIAARGHGTQTVVWDGRDSDGTTASSGVYFVRLSYAGLKVLRRVALVR